MAPERLEIEKYLTPYVREMIERVARAFLDQYAPGQCDCDPSVGISSCAACDARTLLNEDAYGNSLDDPPRG
jgi:hypothetical protein